MSCQWILLASRSTPEHIFGEPGDPFCPVHQKVMDYLKQLDDDFEEIEKTHKAVCEESLEVSQPCAVSNFRLADRSHARELRG